MKFELFVARRISFQSHRSFSRVIIRIALTAIVLSLAIMIISDSIVVGFQSEIKDKITGFAAHIQISKTNSNFAFENEPIKRNPQLEKDVKGVKGVAHMQVFATKPGIIKTEEDIEGGILKGVGKDFDWSFFAKYLKSGRVPHFNDSMPSEEIILSRSLADRLRLKQDDKVVMYFIQQPAARVRQFRISGIYETGIEEIDKLFLLGDIRHVQGLNKWEENQIGGYELFVDNWSRLDDINEQVRYLTDVTDDTRTVRERYPQIFDWLSLLNMNIKIILFLMGMVAAINMVTALLIMIFERTQMIGILKALGARNWSVQRIFIFNSMGLILMGILVGDALAFLLLFIQDTTHVIHLQQESYYVSSVPVGYNWWHLLFINIGAFTFCTLAMLLPSLVVMRVLPARALRFE